MTLMAESGGRPRVSAIIRWRMAGGRPSASTFRSEWGAKVYADLCSVVATGRLAGRTALAVIRGALAAPAPKRTAVQSVDRGE